MSHGLQLMKAEMMSCHTVSDVSSPHIQDVGGMNPFTG